MLQELCLNVICPPPHFPPISPTTPQITCAYLTDWSTLRHLICCLGLARLLSLASSFSYSALYPSCVPVRLVELGLSALCNLMIILLPKLILYIAVWFVLKNHEVGKYTFLTENCLLSLILSQRSGSFPILWKGNIKGNSYGFMTVNNESAYFCIDLDSKQKITKDWFHIKCLLVLTCEILLLLRKHLMVCFTDINY